MNFRNLATLVSLLAFSFLFSCGGDEDENNEIFDPTSEYYIQYKANGKLKTYEADDVPFNWASDMAQCLLPPYKDQFVGITLINRSGETITAEQIEGLENTTLTDASTEPHPIFFFQGKDDFYSSDGGEDPSFTLTITTVEFIGTQQIAGQDEKRLYKVSGTFSGKVKHAERNKKLTITDGRFVVGLSEG